MRFTWSLWFALCFLLASLAYNAYAFRSIEGFEEGNPAAAALWKAFSTAIDNVQNANSYNYILAWIYTHPETSGPVLNDFKRRVFQPNCKFRRDWAINPPPGTSIIPVGILTSEIANASYSAFLKGLSKGNQFCLNALNDAKLRFMEPDCGFLNPSDMSSYSANYKAVFKDTNEQPAIKYPPNAGT